ncbi:MAG: methyltransferase domain-containing protein [Chitinispirillales bacterium]|jgi:predicted SAM-dependent methyltransferase|nr:methyltransferase domain-containing protein [Chitinispirillales bacterium]
MLKTPSSNVKHAYTSAKEGSLADRMVYSARQKIYKILSQKIDLENLDSIIDVGVTANRALILSNFFEKHYPYSDRITAFSNDDASWMEEEYKGLKFVRGTALDMPFEDGTFDLVFSSAVIEHVGTAQNQSKFISECFRVAKKYVFITTPNRYYPVEFHTLLPLIHWLPKKLHRKILKVFGNSFFALEENLNLLTRGGLRRLCAENGIKKYELVSSKFFGLPSNLLLVAKK